MSELAKAAEIERAAFSDAIKDEARRLGFELAGVAPAVTPNGFGRLHEWLGRGFAGEMHYMKTHASVREHPRHVLDGARSVIMLAVNYRSAQPETPKPGQAVVSRYAWGTRDYHDVLREKLKRLADFIHSRRPGCRTRGIVDTAPLLERDFARLAGLGWFGKNTMLINKRTGSWLFLAALLVDFELKYDAPHKTSHCGTCTRCLDACPTKAFSEPYVLDARRCLSYLTIELRDAPIPEDLRSGVGAWLFGCDVCQSVCPWNRKAPVSQEEEFQPREDRTLVDAAALLELDEAEFQQRFAHSPLSRPGRRGLLRNAAIVLGNSGDLHAAGALIHALDDVEPLVRGAAAWALGRLGGHDAEAALQSRNQVEDNEQVLRELHHALHRQGT